MQNPIKLKITYIFNSNSNFSTRITIENEATVRSDVKAIVVQTVKAECEASGVEFNEVIQSEAENQAEIASDNLISTLSDSLNRQYRIEGNKIIYTIYGGEIYETFALNGNTLTLTGSSEGSASYSQTLTKN